MFRKKTVLITGASRGIGRAIAFLFAKKGYCIFINSRNHHEELTHTCEEINALYGKEQPCCIPLVYDVSDAFQVEAMFQEIKTHGYEIHILINNAGTSLTGLFTDMSGKQWQQILSTNLSSAIYCSQKVLPYMISQKGGRILNISSMWGQVGASCEVAYSATKAGLDGFTKALAKELAPSHIAVNALSLGVIDTSMNRHLSPEEKEVLAQDIPAGRFGTPEEAARTALQIIEAPSYLTGQIIRMDGGMI